MTTVEEKQKELDALQAAFDEYIASSRELEEELDADFTKCQNDLAEAEKRNTALSSQLAVVRPQLTSLEAKVSALTDRLSLETQRRISAETSAEEAENKLRQSEGALAAMRSGEMRRLREENEDLCERLAFLEGEVENFAHQRDEERERHREALAEMKGDLAVLKERLAEKLAEKRGGVELVNSPVTVALKERMAERLAENRGEAESAPDHSHFGEGAEVPPPPPAGLGEGKMGFVTLNERLEEKKEGEVGLVNSCNRHGDDSPVAMEDRSNFGKGADLLPPPPGESNGTDGDRKEYVRKLEEGLDRATEELAAVQRKLLAAHKKHLKTQTELEEALASRALMISANGGSAYEINLVEDSNAAPEEARRLSKDAKPKSRRFSLFKFRARSKRS